MFKILQTIQDLGRQREEITRIENHLCEPLLTDTKFVQKICDTVRSMGIQDHTTERRIILMMVLLFFSPKKLVVDSKTSKRTMKALTAVMKISQPLLSIYSRDLIFNYKHYNDFRDNVDKALVEVKAMLMENGIDKDMLDIYMQRFV